MRKTLLFDFGWKFHAGDIPGPLPATKMPLYFHAKTDRAQWGPASLAYREDAPSCPDRWETVDLPHDFIIRQAPQERFNDTRGYFDYHNAWYRNRFRLDAAAAGKRVALLFEGIAIRATVYVNGCLMARHFTASTPFEVDLTDVVRPAGDNLVAVYVETDDSEGWWYEGGGLYRHVWLIQAERVSVDQWGVWVNPRPAEGRRWAVPVETTLRNDGCDPAAVRVRSAVLDAEGHEAAAVESPARIPPKDKAVLRQALTVESPRLWDTKAPNLYTLRTRILDGGGRELDRVDTRFGFRTIEFRADTGFFLNGRPEKIKGVCCHQDYGLTGKAMSDRVHCYRLRRLREMGANGYRAAHYPPAPAAMDALDELGFLVMDETRWFESTPEGLAQLETMIKRDRNHPSVILWSLGNEEPCFLTDTGRRILETMKACVRRLDPSRSVTAAIAMDPLNSPAAGLCDVIGINYALDQYDAVHAKYPRIPMLASECCAVGTTRGWYLDDDPGRGYLSAYDHGVGQFTNARETTWKHILARPWVAGAYQWAGIEHRGETRWPRLCSQSGALDLFLQPKDAFYQNRSHWSDVPMVHILPHWNHAGREGEPIPVWVYTNCEEVELFVDGQSRGVQRPGRGGHGEWPVVYRPGTLRAEGRRGGRTAAAETVETTGPASALRLRLEDEGVRADAEDTAIATCWCADSQGRPVPDAAPLVHFDVNGLGTILGTGSDVCDHTPVPSPDRRMRAGLCAVAVRAGAEPGVLRIYARADGLSPARLDIALQACARRPWVRPAGVE